MNAPRSALATATLLWLASATHADAQTQVDAQGPPAVSQPPTEISAGVAGTLVSIGLVGLALFPYRLGRENEVDDRATETPRH